MKALAKDVDDRYQWCSEMLADLQTFLMSQDVVFTAKSLSSWLKDVFSGEIERERQQIEQYKRVGRDGLIAGVPAAEAKVDVIETLGEAGQAEGDPTVLGGPSFEDIEQAAGAAPEVGPAPGSPAVLGAAEPGEDSGEDFGEEAPTEIFGEIDHGSNPAAAAAAAARAPSGSQPLTRPPKPQPNRAPTSRGDLPSLFAPAGAAPGSAASSGRTPPPAPGDPAAPPSYTPMLHPVGPPAPPVVPASSQPIAVTNGAMPAPPPPPNGQPNQGQGRTLIGQPAPAGLPNYAQGYPPGPYPGPSGPSGQAGPPGQPGSTPMPQLAQPGPGQTPPPQFGRPGPGQTMMPLQMHPMPGFQGGNYPPPYGPPAGPPNGPYGPPGPYAPPGPPYGPNAYGPSNQFNVPVPPIDQMASPEGRKRSSIARDVAIGVAIAALVLGGFLAVKFLVLDSDSSTAEPSAPASPFAKVQPALPAGESANLFVDDIKKATARDQQIFEVSAGVHKLKLVGASGASCDREVKLEAGKTFILECSLGTAAPGTVAGSAGAGSASTGSAAVAPGAESGSAGAGSAGSAAGSGATGSGSAGSMTASAGSPTGAGSSAKTEPADHPLPDKTDRMPVEDSAKSGTADRATDRPAVRPRPIEKTTDRTADRPDKTRSTERAKQSAAEDDLGMLQGGVKPGDKRSDARSDGDRKGYLTVTSKPASQIYIDGNDTGLTTPITGHTLPIAPGKHKVTFVYSGGKAQQVVTVKPGETVTLNKDLR
ncbi:MAG: PEGA domain-containing protein [Deltaproteobacteria bacterium]|nr:MAG: PEGA domain-containing protein [Deltaproteobacteria bacterium]